MKEKILELIRKLGPIVPTDISKELGVDSYVVSAILSELVRSGSIFYSRKKMTTSPLYYLKGQEDLVMKRLIPILKIPEINILDFFNKNKLVLRENLEPQQRYMVDELGDFITPLVLKIDGQEKFFYKHFSISESEIREKLGNLKQKKDAPTISKPKIEPEKHNKGMQKTIELSDEKASDDSKKIERVDSASDKFFEKNDLSIVKLEIIKKSSEFDFIVKQNSSVGQTFFVKYLKKASVNESDISRAYATAQSKKMPCIILISGKLSKKSQELVSNLGYLVNLIKI